VVCEAVRQNFNFWRFFKNSISGQRFRVFKYIFHVRWINIYSVKVIFVPKYVSRVVFKGGILGGARQFWGNPYLNSTTVLFDTKSMVQLNYNFTHAW